MDVRFGSSGGRMQTKMKYVDMYESMGVLQKE